MKVCPNCGGVLAAESIGWKCKNCRGFVSLQDGKFYEYVEKPFMPPTTNADRDDNATTVTAIRCDSDVSIGTPCLICGEGVALPHGVCDGPKICDKCKAAVMKVRKRMEDPYREILD